MKEQLMKYNTPKGQVEAWFMTKKEGCDVQYGFTDSRLRKVIPEDKFLKLAKDGKWEELKTN